MSSQRWARSWEKGSSHGALSTDWDGEKTLCVPGAGQRSASGMLEGQEFFPVEPRPGVWLQPDRRLWPLWQLGDARWGFWAGSGQGAVSRL